MIAENLKKTMETIEAAKKKRKEGMAEDVTLVAVTKNHTLESMRAAIDAGVTDIGENRIQESRQKFDALDREVTWHLIGHLQKNKAKYAVRMFDLIHSVDTIELAKELDREAAKHDKVQDILVQVNLAKEDSKSGVYEEELKALLFAIDGLENLRLKGLMCIAPNYDDVEDTRPLFRRMREIFEEIKEYPLERANIRILSMGMTHDYDIAIEEGATVVRVGTGIFGAREY
ncbi:YggS family pyridoxal phosphate-dependent enzyme [Selenomonas sp. TAMA-11512]|uniref:YggS family pyridoxal phosphate-dependent enzyme n=1 Tax=Selenomonas sp. TAMA-11512 TaxID=3095337 RepID=UPI003093B836|nr:YggS family pyridoxal phosphate-dependent enzyme [Selenomonas sp. TAMA-11512]